MVIDAAERARALVGTRFRPQGRDPRYGLDCVGLVLAVNGMPHDSTRQDYRLRGDHRREILAGLDSKFRRIARTKLRPGDILLLSVAQDQIHLGIATDGSFVHADARLGLVVETPDPPPWPIQAVYRRRVRSVRKGMR